jgi:glutathione S-transferase
MAASRQLAPPATSSHPEEPHMSTTSPTITLHRHRLSGHSHRVQLLLSLLGVPATLVEVDLAAGEHKAAPFLALNPFGQVPVLVDGDTVIADSNAILVYLALRHDPAHNDENGWLPREPAAAAAVQHWLSVAAGQLAFGPARARLITVFGAQFDAADAIARSHALLVVMEQVLAHQPFLAVSRPTLADVAMYAYVAHAPEGNVALDAYPNVGAWLQRIEALPGFVPMASTAVGLRTA